VGSEWLGHEISPSVPHTHAFIGCTGTTLLSFYSGT
jgi:hypothetical protein